MPWSGGGGLLFCLAFLVWANSYVIIIIIIHMTLFLSSILEGVLVVNRSRVDHAQRTTQIGFAALACFGTLPRHYGRPAIPCVGCVPLFGA